MLGRDVGQWNSSPRHPILKRKMYFNYMLLVILRLRLPREFLTENKYCSEAKINDLGATSEQMLFWEN